MGCFEIRVAVDRPLATVFAVYTDTDKWRWCSYIRRVRWTRGQPWVVDSRLLVETSGAIGTSVDQVLTHFELNRRVDYISHFSGITLESRVNFRSLASDQTEIHARIEFVGTLSRIVEFAIEPAIERSTLQFFEEMKRECERMPLPPTPLGKADASPLVGREAVVPSSEKPTA
jgi:uncharacterized membrane protein